MSRNEVICGGRFLIPIVGANVNEPQPDFISRNPQLLDRDRSQLLVVDVQEKLLPAISRADRVVSSIEFLLDVAAELQVPVVVSEQYPKGLGATVQQIASHCVSRRTFEKLRFSAAEGFQKLAGDSGDSLPERNQVVVVGIEAHICVLQTSLDLLGQGFQVVVIGDAVSSRNADEIEIALRRIRDAGGIVASAESVAFEWCETAGTDEFRQISRLVRARDSSRRSDA